MKSIRLAVIGAAAALAIAPSLVRAEAPAARNTILLRSSLVYSSPNLEGEVPYQGHLRVSFQNDGDVTATAVVFDVRDDDSAPQRISDVGTFSPGVAITHNFHFINVHEGEAVHVAEVRYADGTVWTDAEYPGPLTRRQAQ